MSDTGITSPEGEPIKADAQVEPEGQQVEPTPQELVDEATAKATRVEQEIAKYAKVLKGLGIDPDSDFADKFNQGLVTHEELLERVAPQAAQAPVTPQLPKSPADRLSEIIARVDSEGASEDDFKDAVSTFKDYIQGQEKQTAMTNQELLAQRCERTVVDNLLEDPIHKAMPSDELKQIEQRLFLSSTDALVGQEARKTNHPERYLSPEVYDFYSQRNAEDLTKLRDYYKKTGFDAGVAAARGQVDIPQPMSPSGGGAPIPAPTQRITTKNMKNAALEYLKNAGNAV